MKSPIQSRRSIPGMRRRMTGVAMAVLIVFLPALVSRSAQAQTFTLLYTFTGGADRGAPIGGLIMDAQGNLYGTTQGGGNLACPHGCGTVYKVDPTGKETVLYSFTGTGGDGSFPHGSLVWDAQGNLYGTTVGGALAITAPCSGWIRPATRPYFTASPGLGTAEISDTALWFWMVRVTSMALLMSAGTLHAMRDGAAGRCSRWIRPVKRPRCIASPERAGTA